MLTLADCHRISTIETAALRLVNQLLYHPAKAHTDNQGTYWDFGSQLRTNMHKLQRQLRQGYQFSPYLQRTRRVKNKTRILYLPTWPDRVVERWLAETLNRLLHRWFSPHSYAYRCHDFGISQCQWRILHSINPTSYIIKRDISNYFYSIDHEILLAQLAELIDPADDLYRLLRDRIQFDYYETPGEIRRATLGVPFGSSIAPLLANIHLTQLDKRVSQLPVRYFRYADDFLLVADDYPTARQALQAIDESVAELRLLMKPSHKIQICFQPGGADEFAHARCFKYLGLEYTNTGMIRLTREKHRKIINLVRHGLEGLKSTELELIIKRVNNTITNRIRSAAIVDYYLKHVNDERQLREMDMQIAQLVVSVCLGKPFRYSDFSRISYRRLRQLGLISLVHRHRLHVQGHLKVPFLQLQNRLIVERHLEKYRVHRERIEMVQLARKAATK